MNKRNTQLMLVDGESLALQNHDSAFQANDESNATTLNSEALLQLQLEQLAHDDRYHPEISRLPLHHRLNHLALHFAKYAGRIADACRTGDESDIDRTLIDVFIIALSAANVLNIDLADTIPIDEEKGLLDIRNLDLVELLKYVTSTSGKIAGACEAIDHLEARQLRQEISKGVVRMATIAIAYANIRNLRLAVKVPGRLEGVRSSKFFHGRI